MPRVDLCSGARASTKNIVGSLSRSVHQHVDLAPVVDDPVLVAVPLAQQPQNLVLGNLGDGIVELHRRVVRQRFGKETNA